MSGANPLWGAPRIHDEFLKLGIEISQATVAKYMLRPSLAVRSNRRYDDTPPSPTTMNGAHANGCVK